MIFDPLSAKPSTTITARESPATIRLRAGNRNGSARTPGGYSETTAPSSAICRINDLLEAGYSTSMPEPSTAIVGPRAARAPRWAAASTPRAAPLTTHAPAAARSRAMS